MSDVEDSAFGKERENGRKIIARYNKVSAADHLQCRLTLQCDDV